VLVRTHPTRLGLGAWPESPGRVRRSRAGALERLLWHAVGVGVDWVDTAHAYEGGVDEHALGRCLATMPEEARPAVMSKGGIVADGSEGYRRGTAVLRPSVLSAQLDESLRRLGLDALDTYLLHYPDETGVPIEESWREVAALAEQGKMARCGLCAFDLEHVRRCEALRHVDVCLTRLTPLDLGRSRPLLEWCATHGTTVVVWVCGDVGRLLDPSYAGPLASTPYDHTRRRLERLASASLAAEMVVTTAMSEAGRASGLHLEAVAAAWILAQPGVAGLTVGASTGAQLDRWGSGLGAELSFEDVERITKAGEMAVATRRRVSHPVADPSLR